MHIGKLSESSAPSWSTAPLKETISEETLLGKQQETPEPNGIDILMKTEPDLAFELKSSFSQDSLKFLQSRLSSSSEDIQNICKLPLKKPDIENIEFSEEEIKQLDIRAKNMSKNLSTLTNKNLENVIDDYYDNGSLKQKSKNLQNKINLLDPAEVLRIGLGIVTDSSIDYDELVEPNLFNIKNEIRSILKEYMDCPELNLDDKPWYMLQLAWDLRFNLSKFIQLTKFSEIYNLYQPYQIFGLLILEDPSILQLHIAHEFPLFMLLEIEALIIIIFSPLSYNCKLLENFEEFKLKTIKEKKVDSIWDWSPENCAYRYIQAGPWENSINNFLSINVKDIQETEQAPELNTIDTFLKPEQTQPESDNIENSSYYDLNTLNFSKYQPGFNELQENETKITFLSILKSTLKCCPPSLINCQSLDECQNGQEYLIRAITPFLIKQLKGIPSPFHFLVTAICLRLSSNVDSLLNVASNIVLQNINLNNCTDSSQRPLYFLYKEIINIYITPIKILFEKYSADLDSESIKNKFLAASCGLIYLSDLPHSTINLGIWSENNNINVTNQLLSYSEAVDELKSLLLNENINQINIILNKPVIQQTRNQLLCCTKISVPYIDEYCTKTLYILDVVNLSKTILTLDESISNINKIDNILRLMYKIEKASKYGLFYIAHCSEPSFDDLLTISKAFANIISYPICNKETPRVIKTEFVENQNKNKFDINLEQTLREDESLENTSLMNIYKIDLDDKKQEKTVNKTIINENYSHDSIDSIYNFEKEINLESNSLTNNVEICDNKNQCVKNLEILLKSIINLNSLNYYDELVSLRNLDLKVWLESVDLTIALLLLMKSNGKNHNDILLNNLTRTNCALNWLKNKAISSDLESTVGKKDSKEYENVLNISINDFTLDVKLQKSIYKPFISKSSVIAMDALVNIIFNDSIFIPKGINVSLVLLGSVVAELDQARNFDDLDYIIPFLKYIQENKDKSIYATACDRINIDSLETNKYQEKRILSEVYKILEEKPISTNLSETYYFLKIVQFVSKELETKISPSLAYIWLTFLSTTPINYAASQYVWNHPELPRILTMAFRSFTHKTLWSFTEFKIMSKTMRKSSNKNVEDIFEHIEQTFSSI